MNVLFLTLLDFSSFQERNIYTDLLREFIKDGHVVYAISPVEKRKNVSTHRIKEKESVILKLQIGNTQKTNVIEKGISTVRIEPQFIAAIKKYFSQVKFDLVLYSTPPITFCKAIEYVKKRDNAKTYLLLKDIFPQNAVDMNMLSKTGIKGFLYRYFRNKEKQLYKISDLIGCMSPANVDYVLNHNPEVSAEKVEVCPNCIEVQALALSVEEKLEIREKYGIPQDKRVFVYGGNLGKPQGIPFLVECLKSQRDNRDAFFLIVGDGTEYHLLENLVKEYALENVKLMQSLPKDDYDRMIAACDVGMIFLDQRFTIPNFPSRLLSYMQAGLPVFAVTDTNSDVGVTVTNGNFGWWCESNSADCFSTTIKEIVSLDLSKHKEKSYRYLRQLYDAKEIYKNIFIPKLEKIRNEK